MILKARLFSPFVAVLIGLLTTAAVAMLVSRFENAESQARLDSIASRAASAIESRLLAQLTLLRGAAGLFTATDSVSEAAFKAYVTRLRLERYYPGVLGIGYAEFAPDAASADRLVDAARKEGHPNFRIWPAGQRNGYSVIRFLEPLNRRNQAALGFDMMSEPMRRAAMEAARMTGVSAMSGRVRLVQEIDPIKQPGFLLYVPLNDEQRAGSEFEGHYGWVYSPLRAHDLFGAIFADRNLGAVAVEVFDERPSEDRLLYRSEVVAKQSDDAVSRTLEIAGRRWVVRVSPLSTYDEGPEQALIWTIAVAGVVISLLIGGIVLQQATATARTEQEVRLRTEELQLSNSMLLEEGQAREEAEAKVRQMQKVEAIGQLTGGIAHDFNNMLSIVLGNLDMAQRRIEEPDRLRRALQHARAGAERAADLTRRLLAFGRQQTLSPDILDANELVSAMSELVRRTIGEQIELETLLEANLWPIRADASQLENAILNLAINARDAMPKGGLLTIRTANIRVDQDAAGADGLMLGEYVLIAVSDTGQGMTAEVADKAFDPFFTTKEVGKGTGLGLSQVFGYVKQSGGHIKLTSEIDRGTAIEIYLPRFHGSVHAAEQIVQENDAPPGSNGEFILVVEDEEEVRALSVEALRDLGFKVIEASDGREALERLKAHPEVQLLFTDVVMPGMNGQELAEAACARHPKLKVLFTTGYSRNSIKQSGTHAGEVSLLQKPFTFSQLARKVRDTLDN